MVKVTTKPTYSKGDRFVRGDDEFILVTSPYNNSCLINVYTGEMVTSPIYVGNPDAITESELELMYNGSKIVSKTIGVTIELESIHELTEMFRRFDICKLGGPYVEPLGIEPNKQAETDIFYQIRDTCEELGILDRGEFDISSYVGE